MSSSTTHNTATGRGWLGSLGENRNDASELWRLPEAMTDPFASVQRRLAATLESYRYAIDPRRPGLILEWAIAQTGLNDPLSKYTRHELEQAFPRFTRDRDNHLTELVRTLKRSSQGYMVQEALRTTVNPAAKNALQRAMRA